MIPIHNLDDESFDEIMEVALKKIIQNSEDWTNHNLADPGITLLELLAFMKETQQYRLNQITAENQMKYLKLLGTKPGKVIPSRGTIRISGLSRNLLLPKGSRFTAGEIPFENIQDESLYEADIQSICTADAQGNLMAPPLSLASYEEMQYSAFGQEAKEGNQLYLVLKEPVPQNQSIQIYFGVHEQFGISRNFVDSPETFTHLAQIRWEIYTEKGYREVELRQDDTYSFLFSGIVKMVLPSEMKWEEEKKGYVIRAVLVKNDYEAPPLLEEIQMNSISVQQKNTIADYQETEIKINAKETEICRMTFIHHIFENEVHTLWIREGTKLIEIKDFEETVLSPFCLQIEFSLRRAELEEGVHTIRLQYFHAGEQQEQLIGTGRGLANQKFAVEPMQILPDALELLVQEEENCFQIYTMTENFNQSRPEDFHFVYNNREHFIQFGDGEKGEIPTGNIYITKLAESYGKIGNVKNNKITHLDYPKGLFQVQNRKNTSGGEDEETLERCFERVRRDFAKTTRAVTSGDYEYLVKNCQGLLIKHCEVVSLEERRKRESSVPDNTVTVVVEPYSKNEHSCSLSRGYRRNLEDMLRKNKLVGTRVDIISPVYIPVSVYIEVSVFSHYKNIKELIQEAVFELIENREKTYGGAIVQSELYGRIDSLEGVDEVKALVLESNGIEKSVHGDIMLPFHAVPYVQKIDMSVSIVE